MFCWNCGKEIDDNTIICEYCGYDTRRNNFSKQETGKNWIAAYLLAWFLGPLGAHRFYTGHIGIGIAQLLTLGGLFIWCLIDFIQLSFNKFKDSEGKELIEYNKPLGMVGFTMLIIGFATFALLMVVPIMLMISQN